MSRYENDYAEVAARDFARQMYSQADAEDDRVERTRAGQALQGVCKDCGNGTLNNGLNPAFNLDTDDDCDGFPVPQCNVCGSTHLDLL
jgi:hypothetical protein